MPQPISQVGVWAPQAHRSKCAGFAALQTGKSLLPQAQTWHPKWLGWPVAEQLLCR
jgi:hypothetical protein